MSKLPLLTHATLLKLAEDQCRGFCMKESPQSLAVNRNHLTCSRSTLDSPLLDTSVKYGDIVLTGHAPVYCYTRLIGRKLIA